MTQPQWVPPGVDLSRPSVARVYDYFLGGFHNLPVDRDLAEAAIAAYPPVRTLARTARAFLGRAVEYLAAEQGVRQFLDLGSGIPTEGNVHEIVQAVDPGARVVYVDIDPVAVAHGEAILADNPSVSAVQADLRKPELILSLPEVERLIDPAEPTALLLMAVLHFVPDDERPGEIIRRYRQGLGPRSWIALSHATGEFHDRETADGFTDLYARTPTPLVLRDRAQVTTLFQGYQLVAPGLVTPEQWRPGRAADVPETQVSSGWAGVGRAS